MTGGAGQVGRALAAILPEARILDRGLCDVTDAAGVRAAIGSARIVIHLAAMTAVDACEADPNEAHRVNVVGTRNVVDAATEVGARLVYLSTDYVFDGRKSEPYVEDDATNPLNVYGRTKLEGERIVQSSEDPLILRVSWVYGNGPNFIRTILKAALERDSLRIVDDQIGRPTAAVDIASALQDAISRSVTGVIHFTGSGDACSWAELARYALRSKGSTTSVEPIDTATYVHEASPRTIAARPANSVLSLDRARGLGLPLTEWRTAVAAYVAGL